jgi:hypothetical protein
MTTILKMETALFAETLEELPYLVHLKPEN